MGPKLMCGLTMFFVSSVAMANLSSTVETRLGDNNQLIIPFTLNNQGTQAITSESNLVPSEAKVVAPQDAVMFEVTLPDVVGTQRIRYHAGASGCDFYIDIQNGGASPDSHVTYVSAVPINGITGCNVYSSGGVNHLAVSFTQF
ncbi:hypothetical protein [Legionella pneumophila]|uniref:Uncharacterized protein n=1 Tax=Legionella pneumophila subsp. pascullei TaxID=91890 RepID=A0AAX2ITA7_LEGPN|nr:hypothetical protein [Legionella pneumophila]AMP88311.1 hypothetical protein AXF35_00740 [Legionella pneumophila subsp. pascullei]AMP91220.1 hypothetical protein AXF36_00740 [Legionella pneumophila subsp. pascullei]AMP94207.1 hypothetical protein AXF37_00740 [Legionella pneumophila subsp. pascullei]SQG88980.1 Uncharacterised protein [Legionella pneumophila subsp. pascullei]VEH04030.1 Uncharacterised protein [Legionella pneumophila subsp. pascullei]